VIAAGVWVVLGLAVAVAGSRMQLGTLAAPGSGFLPTVSGTVLAVLSAVTLYGEWYAAREGARAPARPVSAGARWRVGVTVVALVAYGFLLNVLGLVGATFVVLGALFRLAAGLGWVASLGATLGATIFAHVLFRVWLKVPFPPGPWGF
jgi:hypothetical protein